MYHARVLARCTYIWKFKGTGLVEQSHPIVEVLKRYFCFKIPASSATTRVPKYPWVTFSAAAEHCRIYKQLPFSFSFFPYLLPVQLVVSISHLNTPTTHHQHDDSVLSHNPVCTDSRACAYTYLQNSNTKQVCADVIGIQNVS